MDQYCLQKLPFFGEQSYDAWEREGGWRSGGSGSVEGKQLLWEGRHKAGPGESGTAVKMQKHKGWPDGCAGQNPEAAGTFGKLDGSALCLLDPLLSVQT